MASAFSNRQKREYYRSQVGFCSKLCTWWIINQSVRTWNCKQKKQRVYDGEARDGSGCAQINNKVFNPVGGEQQRLACPTVFQKNAIRACGVSLTGSLDWKTGVGDGNPEDLNREG